MELVIDRAVWLRGESVGSKLLRVSDGKRCCVGIYLQALGVPDSELSQRGDAMYINPLPEAARWLVEPSGNTSAACQLYRDNDSDRIDPADREQRIAAGFAKRDVTVRFVG